MVRAPLLALAVMLGCSESGASPDAGTPQGLDVYRPCAAADRVGLFQVILGDGFTAVEGRVLSGVVPANVRAVTLQEGGCRILQGRDLFCNPACTAGQTCAEGGTCITYPAAQSVGEVQVRGLKQALTMNPSSVNFYSNGATTLPHPAFAPGDAIELEAAGAQVASFRLAGRGIAALAAPSEPLLFSAAAPVVLTWDPGAGGPERVRAVVDLAHHGGIAASLECDGLPDSGSFTLPGPLVSRLLDIGVAGFPTVTLSRRTADSTQAAPGCIELAVLSEVVRDVSVPGLVSCSSDQDCPNGQTCQADLVCR